MKVIIAGSPGVGKTTVVKGVKKKLKSWKVITMGDIVAEEAGMDRDLLRKRPIVEQRKTQMDAAKRVAKIEGNVLLDTHLLVETPEGFWPGTPKSVLDEIKPHMIILIEADPKEIIQRRMRDKSRKRDIESEEALQWHQGMNRAVAAACAVNSGAVIKIIRNEEGKLENAINEVVNVLKGIE